LPIVEEKITYSYSKENHYTEHLKLIYENIVFLKDTSDKTYKYITQLCIDFQYSSSKYSFSDTFLLLKQSKKRTIEQIDDI
jgi:hypothetical protein